jgi:hypothetical protein
MSVPHMASVGLAPGHSYIRGDWRRTNLPAAILTIKSCYDLDYRPSAFQELYHPDSIYPVKAPTAQLTRIAAADRLFSVPLTRITSVPECAVSSVGFLWGSAAVSRSCGVSVGLAEAPDPSSRSDMEHEVPQLPETDNTFRVT